MERGQLTGQNEGQKVWHEESLNGGWNQAGGAFGACFKIHIEKWQGREARIQKMNSVADASFEK